VRNPGLVGRRRDGDRPAARKVSGVFTVGFEHIRVVLEDEAIGDSTRRARVNDVAGHRMSF
jgi:hypothetical protein